MTRILSWSLIIFSTIVLGGCNDDAYDVSDQIGANVGVVVTDARVAGYDKALATINSIQLISEDGVATNLFAGSAVIDLLNLRNYQELFSVTNGLPPAYYKALRINMSYMELIKVNNDGTEESRPLTVPAGGNITLSFAEPYLVDIQADLFIVLDFDMAKSLNLTFSNSNTSGELVPVIFVQLSETDPLKRIARVRGTIDRIDREKKHFRMCETQRLSQVSIATSDDDLQGCVLIAAGERTGLYSEVAAPFEFTELAVGDIVTVVGRLTIVPDDGIPFFTIPLVPGGEEWDDDHNWNHAWTTPVDGTASATAIAEKIDFGMAAMVIERAPAESFGFINGKATADSIPLSGGSGGAVGSVDMNLSQGQGFGQDTIMPVIIYPQTWILGKRGRPLLREQIVEDSKITVDGKVQYTGNGPEVRATYMIVETPSKNNQGGGSGNIKGTIASIAPDEGLMVVQTEDGSFQSVDAVDATIRILENIGGETLSRDGSFDELTLDQTVTLFGKFTDTGVFDAGSVLVTIN